MTKLSIITINLNNREGLSKTIESVKAQTWKNFEHIIIDGASTDGSVDVIKKNQNGISFWMSEADKGIYDAHNKGILNAKGEYCLFLNSGDFLVNDFVLAEVFEKNLATDIIYGDMLIDDGKGNVLYGKSPDTLNLSFLAYGVLWHSVTFIKRKLFDEYGLYETSYKIVADVDFFLKAIGVGKASFSYVPIAVSQFNTLGFGSDPKNALLLEKERELSRTTHLSQVLVETLKMIQEMQTELHMYKASNSFRLINKLRNNKNLSKLYRLLRGKANG